MQSFSECAYLLCWSLQVTAHRPTLTPSALNMLLRLCWRQLSLHHDAISLPKWQVPSSVPYVPSRGTACQLHFPAGKGCILSSRGTYVLISSVLTASIASWAGNRRAIFKSNSPICLKSSLAIRLRLIVQISYNSFSEGNDGHSCPGWKTGKNNFGSSLFIYSNSFHCACDLFPGAHVGKCIGFSLLSSKRVENLLLFFALLLLGSHYQLLILINKRLFLNLINSQIARSITPLSLHCSTSF